MIHHSLFSRDSGQAKRRGQIYSDEIHCGIFSAFEGCQALITDENFNILLASCDAIAFTKEQMALALENPLSLDDGRVLHVDGINGGYVAWTEDVSDLCELMEELVELKSELSERNGLLRIEYLREAKHHRVEEQSRLYDLLRSATQRQIDKTYLLVNEYQKETSAGRDANKILAKIAVLCSYMKRRRQLVLITDRKRIIDAKELRLAFEESLKAMELFDISRSLYFDTEDQLDGNEAAQMYDFFEYVLEESLDSIKSIAVRAVKFGSAHRIVISVECDADFDDVKKHYPKAVFETFESEKTCLMEVGGEMI